MPIEEEIRVQGGHTPEMIDAETLACLGKSPLPVSLGEVMLLRLANSPFLLGGELSATDINKAMDICEGRWHPASALKRAEIESAFKGEKEDCEALMETTRNAFAIDLIDGLRTAWRAWEIIRADGTAKGVAASDVNMYSPEWMATIIVSATHAMPSLTYSEALWEVPLTMLVHLGAAEYRRDGGITRRDRGEREALRILMERLKKQGKDGNE